LKQVSAYQPPNSFGGVVVLAAALSSPEYDTAGEFGGGFIHRLVYPTRFSGFLHISPRFQPGVGICQQYRIWDAPHGMNAPQTAKNMM
jgi:hypothetical protein